MGVISTDSNGCQLLYGQYMPPYYFVVLSAVLSLLYEVLMTKYAIPAAKTYFLPIAKQHLMFFTRFLLYLKMYHIHINSIHDI